MEFIITLLVIGILGMFFKPEFMWRYKEFQKHRLLFWFNWGKKRRNVVLYIRKIEDYDRSTSGDQLGGNS